MVIIGITLVAVAGMFSIGNRAYINPELGKEKVIAYNLLQRKMEEVRAQDFVNINDESNYVYDDFLDYTLDTDVTDLSLDLKIVKRIDVTITWTNAFGDIVTEAIATKITDWERENAKEEKTTGKGETRREEKRPKKEKKDDDDDDDDDD